MGVFSLILVGGFVGTTSLLNTQRVIYQRTLGASLISLIGQSRLIQFRAGVIAPPIPSSDILKPITLAHLIPDKSYDVFVGGTSQDTGPGTWYITKSSSNEATGGYDLNAYKDILVKCDATINASTSANFQAFYTTYTLWLGNAEEYDSVLIPTTRLNNRRLIFLGRYVLPDGFK